MDDFVCQESQEIDEPIAFRDINFYQSGNECQRTYIYRSQIDSVFWFSFDSKNKLKMYQYADKYNRLQEFEISEDSYLFEYITELNNPDPYQKMREDRAFENPMPTLIEGVAKQWICVFTMLEKDERNRDNKSTLKPTVYFHDLGEKREIAMLSGASMFLALTPSSSNK